MDHWKQMMMIQQQIAQSGMQGLAAMSPFAVGLPRDNPKHNGHLDMLSFHHQAELDRAGNGQLGVGGRGHGMLPGFGQGKKATVSRPDDAPLKPGTTLTAGTITAPSGAAAAAAAEKKEEKKQDKADEKSFSG